MPDGKICYLEIPATDVDASAAFYTKVFGWTFNAWGPPGFYMIEGAGVNGSLQGRRTLIPGAKMTGFECTIGVDSIDATEKAVLAAGGKILLAKSTIPTVGTLMFFQDPEGNVFGAMQYDRSAE